MKIWKRLEINSVKYINYKRALNIFKIVCSFFISKIIRKPILWGMPLSYSIEPTNYCNLKCPECPSGTGELTRQLGFLSLENFQQIINQISDTGFYIQLFFQGEPYLNKKLGEMINYAQQKNVYVSVSTNANLITQRNITSLMENAPDKIIFSLDGLDEESYQKYRVGGTFQKADDALKLLVQEKRKLKMRKPFIELQFIVMKQNEHLLQEVKSYSSLRGVDRVVFKTMKVSSVKNAVEFLPANNKYSRYTIKDGDLKIKGKQLNHCFALWRTAVITWDKRMVPCCFDKDANYSLGDLSENSISEIWHSTPYQKFRQNILNNRKGINICNNCTEGIKVNIFHMEN